MSLTSYRAAPPRGGDGRGVVAGLGGTCVCGGRVGGAWRTWRRPTVPRLGPQYHGRWRVSRPSSGWDRVGHRPPRPPGRPSPAPLLQLGRRWGWRVGCVRVRWCLGEAGVGRMGWVPWRAGMGASRRWAGGGWAALPRIRGSGELYWAIRTAQLSALPRVHLRPIDVMVDHGPRGDLVLRRVSRLDAFSGYPGRTWLPGGAAGATTGAPEVRPPRSSRYWGQRLSSLQHPRQIGTELSHDVLNPAHVPL